MILTYLKRRLSLYFAVFSKGIRFGNGCYLCCNVYGGKNYFGKNSSVRNTKIGFLSYAGANSKIRNANIGNFTSIGPNVQIGLGEHPVDRVSTHPVFYRKFNHVNVRLSGVVPFEEYHETHIGSDCWIGANAIILAGVKIGDGAIIAAGSIVTRDVLPFNIVAGNPAKFIRARGTEESRSHLQTIRWWDWDIEKIQENIDLFQANLSDKSGSDE